jgi:2-polyprenyl-3-methyl-5-hydroxy-6-metoxy-1,4-benzoquinol methylase
MQYLSVCPVCHQEANFSAFLSCKDHTVSNETFNLEQCQSCGFVATNPRPADHDLPRYYQSPAYISHSDISTNLIDKVYKVSRNFTLKWKYDLVHRHSLAKPSSLLDFGCGTGAFLQKCQQRKMIVSGVEPAEAARAQATRNAKTKIYSSVHELSGSFDIITLWHVLEHVSDLNGTIKKLKNTLAENGTMFIAVPNLNSDDAKAYGEYWAAYDVPRHLWHFSRNTMKQLLTSHQLKLHHVVPMRLDAFYVSLLSEKYKRGEQGITNITRAIIQGTRSNQKATRTHEYSSLIYIVRK